MTEYKITFLPGDFTAKITEGATVTAAAAAADLPLHAPCGGQGRCGKCLVRGREGLSEPTAVETRLLTPAQLRDGWRLACQARIIGDARITVPESSRITEHRVMVEGADRELALEPNLRKIALHLPPPSVDDPRTDLNRLLDALGGSVQPPQRLAPLQALPHVLRRHRFHITAVLAGDSLLTVESGDTTQQAYGLAVDIGTTTVVAYLCHLGTGELVAVASDLNSQAQWGDDVISRLRAASNGSLPDLSRAIITVINDLIERACHKASISPESVYEISIVGNTCMTHLFLGVPPAGLGSIPFVPSFRQAHSVNASELGLDANPEASVYVTPNIGGFVGADTVGVILTSELDRTDGLRLALDIGTNGEIVVARKGELYACSTAAGPAFEGAKITTGMRASTGAIDRLSIEDDVHLHVIGDALPRGLCGSGLVDAIAELLRIGVITPTGRMINQEEAGQLPEKVARRITQNDEGVQFILAWPETAYAEEPIALTARDVRETQLAKAALFAGMDLMLDELGADFDDLDEMLLAGAFGNYISRESARAIGLIPNLPDDVIRSIGNAAGVGARLVLCSLSERKRAERIADSAVHIELSESKGFYDRFADAMMLQPLPERADK